MVARQVGGDPQQPGFQRATFIEAPQRSKSAYEGLLGYIFCVIGITQDKISQAEDGFLMCFDQLDPRRLISLDRPLDKVCFFQINSLRRCHSILIYTGEQIWVPEKLSFNWGLRSCHLYSFDHFQLQVVPYDGNAG